MANNTFEFPRWCDRGGGGGGKWECKTNIYKGRIVGN